MHREDRLIGCPQAHGDPIDCPDVLGDSRSGVRQADGGRGEEGEVGRMGKEAGHGIASHLSAYLPYFRSGVDHLRNLKRISALYYLLYL